jgi:hypothetical protein
MAALPAAVNSVYCVDAGLNLIGIAALALMIKFLYSRRPAEAADPVAA